MSEQPHHNRLFRVTGDELRELASDNIDYPLWKPHYETLLSQVLEDAAKIPDGSLVSPETIGDLVFEGGDLGSALCEGARMLLGQSGAPLLRNGPIAVPESLKASLASMARGLDIAMGE